jgi:hypothetical protein
MTTRGTPKCDYASSRGKKIVIRVFEWLEGTAIERGDVPRIAGGHEIPPRTIGDCYERWAGSSKHSWRHGNHLGYADCNRIFINEQEMMLCERIQSEFIDKRLFFTDNNFRMLAITAD